MQINYTQNYTQIHTVPTKCLRFVKSSSFKPKNKDIFRKFKVPIPKMNRK